MKPLSRLLISFLIVLLLCQLSFSIFTKGIRKYQVHNTERLTELLINHTNYDALFIGSSRTHFSINPQIIDTICKINSYNAGIEGGNLYEFEMILKAFLENHPTPKYIILTLDLNSFSPGMQMFNYPIYFPFTANKVIHKYLSDNGHLTISKELIPFLKISDYDDDTKGFFIKGLMGKTEILPGDFQYKGYLSNTSNCIRSGEPIQPKSDWEISEDRKQSLERIIQICHQKNSHLIFSYAPEYKGMYQQVVRNCNDIFALIDNYSKNNNIPFFRDDRLGICENPLLFANIAHLNKEGAKQYSILFARELKQIINRK